MKQRVILGSIAFWLAASAALCGPLFGAASEEIRQPNIVLILADDQGYRELGVQGGTDIPTPHIDSLARNGVRFTNGYVTCPVCAPTRAGLLTGRYQQRFGFETNPGPEAYAEEDFGLPRTEVTLAERLKPLGYATGMFGKWHVGYAPDLQPPARGFDEFFGFLSGANNYFPGARSGGQRSPILRGTAPVEEQEYLTDAFGREAVAFIDKHAGEPFFLYLPFNAVHAPLEATEAKLDGFGAISERNRRIFAGMLSSMDDNVGRVLEALRRHKLEERTLIFFLSDNGGPTPQTTSSNLPLRGYKGQVLEGGIRIPFVVQWKGHVPAGRVDDRPVISLDIHPTALAAAGQEIAPEWKLDGVNLLPYLTGEDDDRPHETLYWRTVGQWAIRQGDWKLVQLRGESRPQLFHLAKDIGEASDLAGQEPARVKELTAAWNAWNEQLMEPKWQRQDARGPGRRAPGGRAASGQSARDRFIRLDRNGDGKLTAEELPRAELFKRLDANGDGMVTLEEARKSLPAGAPRRPRE